MIVIMATQSGFRLTILWCDEAPQTLSPNRHQMCLPRWRLITENLVTIWWQISGSREFFRGNLIIQSTRPAVPPRIKAVLKSFPHQLFCNFRSFVTKWSPNLVTIWWQSQACCAKTIGRGMWSPVDSQNRDSKVYPIHRSIRRLQVVAEQRPKPSGPPNPPESEPPEPLDTYFNDL